MPKIFSQSIFFPINMLEFCQFLSSNCTETSVRFQDPMNSVFIPEEDLTYFDEFRSLFEIS